MRTTLTLTLAFILAGGLVRAGQLANGMTFQAPAGWTVKSNEKVAILLPPDRVNEGNDPSELYIVASPDGIPDGIVAQPDPQQVSRLFTRYFPGATQVTAAGPPQRFGGGYLYRFDTISQGVGLRVHIYLTGLPGRGVGVLLAIASPALLARREVAFAAVAASLVLSPAGDIAEQWNQRLRGRKLYLFNGYSSTSNSGGMNSQRTLSLAPDGAYQFRRSSSVSIYSGGLNGSSASQNSDRGRWRIYQSDTRILLELVSAEGTTENIVLTSQGGKTLLNGRQWLVGD